MTIRLRKDIEVKLIDQLIDAYEHELQTNDIESIFEDFSDILNNPSKRMFDTIGSASSITDLYTEEDIYKALSNFFDKVKKLRKEKNQSANDSMSGILLIITLLLGILSKNLGISFEWYFKKITQNNNKDFRKDFIETMLEEGLTIIDG